MRLVHRYLGTQIVAYAANLRQVVAVQAEPFAIHTLVSKLVMQQRLQFHRVRRLNALYKSNVKRERDQVLVALF